MKEAELRKAAVCCLCNRKIGQTSLPIFYRVRIERHGLKMDALQRQTGLAMLLGGSAALAMAMGPDEEMTTPLMDPVTVTVCEDCSMRDVSLVQMVEMAPQENTESAEDEEDADE